MYATMWSVADSLPWILPVLDRRIVQLRAYLASMDSTPYLADQEMLRMRRVVQRTPSVLRAIVGAQMRVRFGLTLRRTSAARRKLVEFRLAVDRGAGPAAVLSFELFLVVAGFVLD